ncbi:hypothetical protein B4110_3348 [Parageobacillus toebii]|uniref:Uncharacterized protein n=1 Tax=Parageobacillus toebii TaxID=153151 RepID=A0A150N4K9_9BACL|nr:hypothetical protein I656_01985 [Geobacillus sp. WSUCF1]KYD31633.1 hypothetical protein B4110_3348 [Parageobacillus toebii]
MKGSGVSCSNRDQEKQPKMPMRAFLAPSGGMNHVILIANIKDMSSVSG